MSRRKACGSRDVRSCLDLAADPLLDPIGTAHLIRSTRIYLFSGDQDDNLAPAMRDHLTGVAE